MMESRQERNNILSITTLLRGWSRVVRIEYEQIDRSGRVRKHDRDLLDRGAGVTVLLYNLARGTVLLLRQPRVIATIAEFHAGETIEACSGFLETQDPEECAKREVEEETGHRVASLTPVGVFYASPGSSLELVHVFLAEYSDVTKVSDGGGDAHEGEDIELLEVSVGDAMLWVMNGTIKDARTALALQHLFLHIWSKR